MMEADCILLHRMQMRLLVVDAKTQQVLNKIMVGNLPHSVILDNEEKKLMSVINGLIMCLLLI